MEVVIGTVLGTALALFVALLLLRRRRWRSLTPFATEFGLAFQATRDGVIFRGSFEDRSLLVSLGSAQFGHNPPTPLTSVTIGDGASPCLLSMFARNSSGEPGETTTGDAEFDRRFRLFRYPGTPTAQSALLTDAPVRAALLAFAARVPSLQFDAAPKACLWTLTHIEDPKQLAQAVYLAAALAAPELAARVRPRLVNPDK